MFVQILYYLATGYYMYTLSLDT